MPGVRTPRAERRGPRRRRPWRASRSGRRRRRPCRRRRPRPATGWRRGSAATSDSVTCDIRLVAGDDHGGGGGRVETLAAHRERAAFELLQRPNSVTNEFRGMFIVSALEPLTSSPRAPAPARRTARRRSSPSFRRRRHGAAREASAGRVSAGTAVAEVGRGHCGRRLHLHSGDSAGALLQDDVDLDAVAVAEVEKRYWRHAPARLALGSCNTNVSMSGPSAPRSSRSCSASMPSSAQAMPLSPMCSFGVLTKAGSAGCCATAAGARRGTPARAAWRSRGSSGARAGKGRRDR